MNYTGEHTPERTSARDRFETMSLARRTFLIGVGAAALGGLLAGCSTEPPISSSSETAVPHETKAPTPKSTETLALPDIKGVNGEYFSATPSWEQDFSALKEGSVDTDKWNVLTGPGPGNNEAQYYTNDQKNVRIEDGVLKLQAHVDHENDYDYTSGRLETLGKQDFQYGKFEIVAKMPKGVGTWPAAWLLPSENVYLNKNPGVNFNSYYVDGEIDFMEAIGSEQNKIYGIAHSLKNPDVSKYDNEYFATQVVPDADTKFHTYGLEWTPTNLTFLIDNKEFYSVTKQDYYDFRQWPYDQKYHLIMNLAIGGSWAGQQTDLFPGDGVDKSALPATLEIKSVKHFDYVSRPES